MLNITLSSTEFPTFEDTNYSNISLEPVIDLKFPIYIRNTATVFCAILLFLGTVGNLMVPLVIYRTKELRNSTNMFLMNLSFADLLVLIVCMPPTLVELYTKPETWNLGEGMCRIVPYVEMSAAHGSVLTILAISFERYYAICQPLKAGYTCTKVRAMVIIFTIWIVALTITSPVLILTEYKNEEYFDGSIVPVCLTVAQKFWHRIYFCAIIITFFVIPLLILLIVYTYIARHLMMDTSELSSSSERLQMRARIQVVFMLIAVVLSFFFCLLPFRIFTLYVMLASSEQIQSLGMEAYNCLLYFCRLMLYTNSALNPILYNVISSKFRESFLKLIGYKVKRHLGHTVSQKFRTSVSGTRSSLISGSTQSSQSGSHVILILSKNSPKKNIKNV